MLADIVTELAANVQAAVDQGDYEIVVYPGMLFNPSTTAIDIYPDEPFRDEETAGMGDVSGGYRFVVRARTGLNDLDSGQTILLELMDDETDLSLGHALGDDETLNGYATSVYVTGPSGFRPFRDLGGEGTMAGVIWNVLVLAAYS
jgi:hypothetical protein